MEAAPARPGSGVFDELSWAVVLVIDDQDANVLLLRRLLERMGLGRVVGITDPREAVARYRELAPDLVLVDLHMPHLDGIGVLDALQAELGPDAFVPVVMLTADATESAKKTALAAGATDFLTKPFDHTEVTLRVRNLLRTRLLHTALRHQNEDLRSELADHAAEERRRAEERAERTGRIRNALDVSPPTMVFQPIVHLASGGLTGVEALARFPGPPQRPPDEWFAEAGSVGLGVDLELRAASAAVGALARLPEPAYLAINVSPAVILDGRIAGLIAPEARRVVLELTEHEAVAGYEPLVTALSELRRTGARLAVDDAGSGYASLRHILRLEPDIIKLDLDLVRDIHVDPARRALAASMVRFSRETGAAIVAEGIETAAELETLRALDVGHGQGYHLARPGPLDAVVDRPGATGPLVLAAGLPHPTA